jgi:hypothetical protein
VLTTAALVGITMQRGADCRWHPVKHEPYNGAARVSSSLHRSGDATDLCYRKFQDQYLTSTIDWMRVPMALSRVFQGKSPRRGQPAASRGGATVGRGRCNAGFRHLAVHDDGVRVAVLVARVDVIGTHPPYAGQLSGTKVAAADASRNAPDVEAAAVPSEIANEAARSVGCGSRTAAIGLVPPSGGRRRRC